MKREIAEAVRIQHKYSPPNAVIYAYSNIQQLTGTQTLFWDKVRMNLFFFNVANKLKLQILINLYVDFFSSLYVDRNSKSCLSDIAILFIQDHLDASLKLSADMGASGVVLWGSSSYYRSPNQCSRLQTYMRDVLGPYVKNLTTFMTQCSQVMCNGNGR